MVVSCTRSSRIADLTALSWSEASQIVNFAEEPEGLAVLAQDPRAEGVERADRDLLAPAPRRGAATRSRISPAALFVKVTARMLAGSTPSETR